MSDQENKKTYEERKALKEIEKNKNKQSRVFKKVKSIVIWLVIISFLIALVVFLSRSGQPEGEDLSQAFPIVNRYHISVGSSPSGEYSSNPPTSGWHYPQTASVDFYEEEVEDQYLIHNLEHGDIWISYKPELNQNIIGQLKDLVGNKVIVTPRNNNDSDIAVAAWGRLDTFNESDFNLSRITDFIKRYKNRGPEKVSPNLHGI